jgi:ketosteroid isomerase-like protein
MTAEEQRNLETSRQYEELYNNDIERFVREVYTADCTVYCMGGPTIHGTADFLKVEQTVLRAAPGRRMRVVHRHPAGDCVIVEAVVTDSARGADWELPFVAVLTCRDGKIHTDRSYAEWPRWPGL